MRTKPFAHAFPLVAFVVMLAQGCGFDSPILNSFTELGPDFVQDPAPYDVYGQVYGLPGAQVDYWSASGVALPQYTATADAAGSFKSEFPGTTEYRNLVVSAREGSSAALGLALRVPRNENVWERFGPYHLGAMSQVKWADGVPFMANIDDRTTAITLILLRKAATQGIGLGSVSFESMNEAVAGLVQSMASGGGAAGQVLLMVDRLLAATRQDRLASPVFVFPDSNNVWLSELFLAAVPVDYTGDGLADLSSEAFVATLDKAGESLQLSGCKSTDTITVVMILDMNDSNRDSNCSPINPFKFAKDEEGKSVWITGGMFTSEPEKATPACSSAKADDCLTQDEWAGVNQALGNWVPNKVGLRDDGQGADAVAGDNLWTISMEVPYIATTTSTGKRKGVRIGYKYTYGFAGQNWGGSEEWPGNNRILEVEDTNGDGLVVRYDYFADETSNKNVSNSNQGLCGSTRNPWPEDATGGCWSDTGENRIDVDGDCVVDEFPVAGSVSPSCPGSAVPAVGFFDRAFIPSDSAPVISSVLPGKGPNGGGFLVVLKGSGFRPGMEGEINTASSGTVSGNRFAAFFAPDPGRLMFQAPPFLAEQASLALFYTKDDGSNGTVKATISYELEKKVGCSVVYPAEMPQTGVPSGAVGQPSFPVVVRLETSDAEFLPGLRVEVGLSPECCDEGDTCLSDYGPCYAVPDPRYEDGWSFLPMSLSVDCVVPDAAGVGPCADGEAQFSAGLLPDSGPARYRYAARYSFDAGRSWDYCDLKTDDRHANEDGFALKDAGTLWVE